MTNARRWLWLAALLARARARARRVRRRRRRRRGGRRHDRGRTTSGDERDGRDHASVTLQLKWVTQAQFAGYYAAEEQGYYADENLDVTIKPGGPDITPEQVVASGQAEFGIDWLPALLAARDQGGDLVNIAQVFARSGMLEVTHKDSGITDVAGMKGKKVGVWCCGNENELYAALVKNGIDPKSKDDVTIVNQPFDMNLFLDTAGRRRRRDDLQRARPGARSREPRHRRALHARRSERDLDGRRRHRHARRRHLHAGRVDRRRGEPGHRPALPEGELPRLDLLPRQLRTSASRPCSTTGRRSARGTSAGS